MTFLLTDIEGSTRLWQGHPQGMSKALARHDTTLVDAVELDHWIYGDIGTRPRAGQLTGPPQHSTRGRGPAGRAGSGYCVCGSSLATA